MAPSQPTAATPSVFAQAILGAYKRYGKNPAHALAVAQIAPEEIHAPNGRITAAQFERLSGAAMRELDDEALGWFGRRLPWGSYGMLARASISAPTLRVALTRWCRHHGLICADITLRLEVDGDVASITLHEHVDLGDVREFCQVSVLRNILGVACWLVDSRIPLLAVHLPFEAPLHRDAYAVLFSGPVRFSDGPATLCFDAHYLDLPLRRDEKALQHMLQNALPLTVLQYRRDRLLMQRARQTLANHARQTHNADTLAALLHVSPRTLHRQLKEEGTTLQALKDEVRKDRAIDLLQRTERPIKQVADASGFRNEKSFIRAFRTWTGQSPAHFRRQRP